MNETYDGRAIKRAPITREDTGSVCKGCIGFTGIEAPGACDLLPPCGDNVDGDWVWVYADEQEDA